MKYSIKDTCFGYQTQHVESAISLIRNPEEGIRKDIPYADDLSSILQIRTSSSEIMPYIILQECLDNKRPYLDKDIQKYLIKYFGKISPKNQKIYWPDFQALMKGKINGIAALLVLVMAEIQDYVDEGTGYDMVELKSSDGGQVCYLSNDPYGQRIVCNFEYDNHKYRLTKNEITIPRMPDILLSGINGRMLSNVISCNYFPDAEISGYENFDFVSYQETMLTLRHDKNEHVPIVSALENHKLEFRHE
jgi:hypothetical protein